MTLEELRRQLDALDVKVWIDQDKLRVSAPPGVLTAELQAELARHKPAIMAALRQTGEVAANGGLRPMPRPADIPLSFSQESLWVFQQLHPHSCVYNLITTSHSEQTIDIALLQKSLNELVRRHEILRTIYYAKEGMPFQRILPPVPVTLEIHDLLAWPEPDRQAEAQRLIDVEARQTFDLECGPPFRVSLYQFSPNRSALLLVIHHIAVDGWSLGIIARELQSLYGAFAAGRPSPLADLPIQYADYALWQRQQSQDRALEQQLTYWKDNLKGAAVLDLPLDHARPAEPSYHGALETAVLPRELTNALNKLSQQAHTTMFMLLLAAFQALLGRYSGSEDIVVGAPVANRNWVQVEGLIGFFVNTLVLRTNLGAIQVSGCCWAECARACCRRLLTRRFRLRSSWKNCGLSVIAVAHPSFRSCLSSRRPRWRPSGLTMGRPNTI